MNRTMTHRGPDGEGYYVNTRYTAQGSRFTGGESESAEHLNSTLRIQNSKSPTLGEGRGNVGLAHRRLSIIDLSTGKQPLCYTHNENRLVFVSEIKANLMDGRTPAINKFAAYNQ